MSNVYTLREYSQIGALVKRFSYTIDGKAYIIKPKRGEQFILAEEYMGDRSMYFIVCMTKDGEIWRQSIVNANRITFVKPMLKP